jgi:S-adenosylmethionine synthetase
VGVRECQLDGSIPRRNKVVMVVMVVMVMMVMMVVVGRVESPFAADQRSVCCDGICAAGYRAKDSCTSTDTARV